MKLEDAQRLKDELLSDMCRCGTLRATFHAGPGAGKSTTNALVFGALKQRGHNVEMAHEFAKDLTWEGAAGKLAFQPYVAAKQMWRERRLDGQVEAILSDTSTLLSLIYGTEEGGATPAFCAWLVDDYKRHNRLDFFLERDPTRAYNPKGRNQTQEQAEAKDAEIKSMLLDNNIAFETVQVDKDNNSHVGYIVDRIERALILQNGQE